MWLCYFFVVNAFNYCCCDWASDWMSPIQHEINNPAQNNNEFRPPKLSQSPELMGSLPLNPKNILNDQTVFDILYQNKNMEMMEDGAGLNLKVKLERTLENAKLLADMLHSQILEVDSRENLLKEAIINGRYGVTTVKVTSINQIPRQYIIRDGVWALCNGILQQPGPASERNSANLFSEIFSIPKCVGNEMAIEKDPCAFNSLIKYETIPLRKRIEYQEDTYLCLKHNFNSTMEQYLSVPRSIVNATCKNGVIRSVDDNVNICGIRTLAEYTYYPYKSSTAGMLPLEYCTEQNGSCKLIVGWHIANGTVDNFQYLKDEVSFKNMFVKSDNYMK